MKLKNDIAKDYIFDRYYEPIVESCTKQIEKNINNDVWNFSMQRYNQSVQDHIKTEILNKLKE